MLCQAYFITDFEDGTKKMTMSQFYTKASLLACESRVAVPARTHSTCLQLYATVGQVRPILPSAVRHVLPTVMHFLVWASHGYLVPYLGDGRLRHLLPMPTIFAVADVGSPLNSSSRWLGLTCLLAAAHLRPASALLGSTSFSFSSQLATKDFGYHPVCTQEQGLAIGAAYLRKELLHNDVLTC